MRKISERKKSEVLRLWLEGNNFRCINSRTKISLGAISKFVKEARERTPDLDELRELNVEFRKAGSNVPDAIRGSRLLEKINMLGINLDGLEFFIEASKRISSERGVKAESFIEGLVRFMELEEEAGKSYGEILSGFEEAKRRVEELRTETINVQEEKRKLIEEKTRLEDELVEIEERRLAVLQELKDKISTQMKLKRLGLEKVDRLAEFIEDYEALDFNVEEIKKLAKLMKGLKTIGIEPYKIGDYIRKRGSLEDQIAELIKRKSESERILRALERKVKEVEAERDKLLGNNDALFTISKRLEIGQIIVPCSFCGLLISIGIPTKEAYQEDVKQDSIYGCMCLHCGSQNWMHPRDVVFNIGWIALPTTENIS